jgi:hypothetical protein
VLPNDEDPSVSCQTDASSSASTVNVDTSPAPNVGSSPSPTVPVQDDGPPSPTTPAPSDGASTSTIDSTASTAATDRSESLQTDTDRIKTIQSLPAVHQPTDDDGQEIPLFRQYAIIAQLASGTTYREICQAHRVSSATLAQISKRLKAIDAVATAKLMQASTLDALESWRTSMKTAALNGRHTPAKDWLLHSKALDPVAESATPTLKVDIVIGMPGRSISTQVIETQEVTPTQDDSE